MSARRTPDGGYDVALKGVEAIAFCSDCRWFDNTAAAPRAARRHSREHDHRVIVVRARRTMLLPPGKTAAMLAKHTGGA